MIACGQVFYFFYPLVMIFLTMEKISHQELAKLLVGKRPGRRMLYKMGIPVQIGGSRETIQRSL